MLNYIETGTGRPLFMIHGNGGDLTYFENQIGAFSDTRRVIAVDTPGHGDSPRGEGPFTIERFACDLKDLMTDMQIASADLLGFSDGANIALTFALKYPEMTDRLILCGANLDPSGLKPLPRFAFRSAASQRNEKKAEIAALAASQPNIKVEDLHNCRARTLVIAGTFDIIRKSHTKMIAENLPDSRLVFITGGHSLPKEHPVPFNQAVRDFLTETDPKRIPDTDQGNLQEILK